jgi:hypothetical protein
MTVISRLAPATPKPNNPLITSAQEHLRLVAQEVSVISIPIVLTNLVAQYAHDETLTNWHTALSRLNAVPSTIPHLPLTSDQFLDGICAVKGC